MASMILLLLFFIIITVVRFEFNNTKYVVNESINIAEICVRTVPGGAEVGPDIPISFDLIFNDKTANGKQDYNNIIVFVIVIVYL